MMRYVFLAAICLAVGCVQETLKSGDSVTTYTLPDWPSTPQQQPDAPAQPAAAAQAGFHIETPQGYKPVHGAFSGPVVAMCVKPLYEGEAALIVERYDDHGSSSTSRSEFAAKLGRPAATRDFGGENFEVYEGIEFTSPGKSLSRGDPYADRLGSEQPPLLNPLEGRRFPVGGDAFRLYRCRERGAWSLLRAYRKARRRGDLDSFRSQEFGTAERGLAAACFGQATLLAMDAGDELPKIPKPSLRSLHERARQEWDTGTDPFVEREAVYLRDFPGGFYALRLRAPKSSFKSEYPAFARFVAGFQVTAP